MGPRELARVDDEVRGGDARAVVVRVVREAVEEAVAALANLAMGEDNQKQFMKEGGMAAIEVMTLSKNPRVQHNAKRLISRLRLAKMRTAARFAGQMATQQKELARKREAMGYMGGD